MDPEIRKVAGWFEHNDWPSLPCPSRSCVHGRVVIADEVRNDLYDYFALNWHDLGGDPTDITGVFVTRLQCTRPRCKTVVAVSGEVAVYQDETSGDFEELLRIRTLLPAVPLFNPPGSTPDSVTNELLHAAEHIWRDPGAAANSLRRSLEALLAALGIEKKGFESLHLRIERFRESPGGNDSVADLIEAVKWVGNGGTHVDGTSMTSNDVLETAELIELALGMLYAEDNSNLLERASRIIEAKKLVP